MDARALQHAIEQAQAAREMAWMVGTLVAVFCWIGWMALAASIGAKAGRGFEAGFVTLLVGPLGVPLAYLIVAEWRLEKIQQSLSTGATPPLGDPGPPALPDRTAAIEMGPPRQRLARRPATPADEEFLGQLGIK